MEANIRFVYVEENRTYRLFLNDEDISSFVRSVEFSFETGTGLPITKIGFIAHPEIPENTKSIIEELQN